MCNVTIGTRWNKNPVTNSLGNCRGTSDLTSSIGAAYVISTSRSRTERTGSPLLSCKTATRISNRDTIAIRAPVSVLRGESTRKHHRGKREDSRNRIESNRCFRPTRRFRRRRHSFLFFFFLLSHTRQQLRYLSGPLNFHLSFKLNRQQRKIINQLKFQKNHGCYFSLEQSLSHFIR